MTLYRGELRLSFAEDCYRGQALLVRDNAAAARGLRDWLVQIAECCGGQLQRPRQFQLVEVWPTCLVEDPRH